MTFKPATTHEEASNICEQANLTLVSYPGKAREESTIRCNQCGHEWQTTILNIKRGASCSKCRVKISTPTKSTPEVEEIVSLLPQIKALLAVAPTLIEMAEHEQERLDCAKSTVDRMARIKAEKKKGKELQAQLSVRKERATEAFSQW